jgi:uncharacterized membrane protein
MIASESPRTEIRFTKNWIYLLAGVAIIVITGFLVYGRILFAGGVQSFPWGSDTLGHVSRLEFLQRSLGQGNMALQLFPNWYLGIQIFRYYPPLTYYLLALITLVVPSSLQAVNLFLFLCALLGGLSWLLYRKWLKWPLAIAGGVLFLVLPDNVRVAFAEGNLPRVLASTLLPMLVFFILRATEEARNARFLFAIAGLMAVVVFCHPMMAAIDAVFFLLLLLCMWAFKQGSYKAHLTILAAIVLGIGLSGWWLLPSLTGGITELSTNAVEKGLASFPLSELANPFLRLTDPEVMYPGLSIVLIGLGALLFKQVRSRRMVAFIIPGMIGLLALTTWLGSLFTSLPAGNLLWPNRFTGIASLFLLIACLLALNAIPGKRWWLTGVLVALIAADFGISIRLIYTRAIRADTLLASQQMAAQSGWREATLDESRLGSAVTYLIDHNTGREQVFGWAYQGARTALNAASLNDAISMKRYGYLADRLNLYGVDDILILNDFVPRQQFDPVANAQGFQEVTSQGDITYFHRDGQPRAVFANWPAFGIGSGALSYAYLYPQIVLGNSNFLDDYSLGELSRYRVIVLSGFGWHNKDQAEDMVRQLTGLGVKVVIDLTRTQEDPVAKIPEFLGVWGEPVILPAQPITLNRGGELITLSGFGSDQEPWHTFVPQSNTLVSTVTLDYLGKNATLLGSLQVDGGEVWFVGLNLVYHVLQTNDQTGLAILTQLLELPPDSPSDYATIPLLAYRADQHGYSFGYSLEEAQTLLVPVADFDGTAVYLDGTKIDHASLENLVVFNSPAGTHVVEIRFEKTSIYTIGSLVSVLSFLLLAAMLFVLFIGSKGHQERK